MRISHSKTTTLEENSQSIKICALRNLIHLHFSYLNKMKLVAIMLGAAQVARTLNLGFPGGRTGRELQNLKGFKTFRGLFGRQGGRCGVDYDRASCDEGYCCSKQGLVQLRQPRQSLNHTDTEASLRSRWCGKGYEYCSSPACQVDFCDSCDGNIRPDGPDTREVDRPKNGQIPYGQPIYHCEKYGTIALSYDDGPYDYTADLLNLLKVCNHFHSVLLQVDVPGT